MTQSLIQMVVELLVALDMLLKVSLVLCLGWALHFFLAWSNPRWRVLLWRAVSVGILLVPLLGSVMPTLKLTLPQSPTAAVISPNHGNNALLESEPAPLRTSPDIPAIAQPQQTPHQNIFITLRQYPWLSLSILWAGVSLFFAFKLFFSLRGVNRLLLSSTPVNGDIQEILNDLCRNLDITCAVELRASDELSSPFLYGFRRPVIILPERMTQDDYIKELPAIFVHELTHLKGHDLTWMTLIHTLSIALWFHPLTWRMRAAHAASCEAVCDAVAARHIGSPLAYSRTLARIALELVALPPTVGGIAMARMPEVRRRLEWLKGKIYVNPITRRWVAVSLMLGLVITVVIAGVRVVPADGLAGSDLSNARLVRFPGKLSLGKFKLLDNAIIDRWYDHWVEYSDYHGTNESDDALEEITVPTGKGLVLYVDNKKAGDLSFLDAFKPDDIQVLDLAHLENLKDQDLAHLGKLTGLKVLSLHDSNVSDAGIKYLKPLTSLRFLMLNFTNIADNGLSELQGLKSLNSLQIHETKITDDGLAALEGMPQLKHLRIGGKNISDAGLVHLKGLGSLLSLWIQSSPITDAGIVNLSSLSSLREIQLSSTKITDQGFQSLNQLPDLENLQIYGNKFTMAAIPAIKQMRSLKSLTIGGNEEEMDDDWFSAVSSALPNCKIKDHDQGMVYPPPAWRQRFNAVYHLNQGEVLRRIAPPYIPERKQYFMSLPGNSQRQESDQPSGMVLHWKKNLRRWSTTFGESTWSLSSYISDAGGISMDRYTGPRELLHLKVPACDWIVDTSASLTQRFEALEKILSTEMGLKIHIAQKDIGCDVIVATGHFKPGPRTDVRKEPVIKLSAVENEEKGYNSIHSNATIAGLLNQLAASTRHQVINKAEFSEYDTFTIQSTIDPELFDENVDRQKQSALLQKILDNLTKQTTLQFKIEHQPGTIWVVSTQ